jgi:hypothetical protein
MEQHARDLILSYANEEMQRNAALFGEHKGYVNIVLTLLRDDYREQVEKGNTLYSPNPEHIAYLDSIKPF